MLRTRQNSHSAACLAATEALKAAHWVGCLQPVTALCQCHASARLHGWSEGLWTAVSVHTASDALVLVSWAQQQVGSLVYVMHTE